MNEILPLLENLITCGENMTKIGRLLKESLTEDADKSPQKAKPEPARKAKAALAESPEKAEPPSYTFVDVRKAFSAKSHAGYTAQVRELIGKYGAERLSDVKETDYPALMADLEVIG